MQQNSLGFDTRSSSSSIGPFAPRIRRQSDDPFFLTGDRIALQTSEAQLYFYTEEGAGDDVSGGPQAEVRSKDAPRYQCSAIGCNKVFDSLIDCDGHYHTSHTLQCAQCHAILNSDHLLDLHLLEEHDSYFASAVSRGRASYRCLVPTCDEYFANDASRLIHLKETHLYPKWFRFRHRGCRTSPRTALQMATGKMELGKNILPTNTNVNMDLSVDIPSDTPSTFICARRQSMLEKKKVRKVRQKKARANVPCTFFKTEQGCRRGDRFDFLHATSESLHSGNGSLPYPKLARDNDMDLDGVEAVTEKFKHSLGLVPKSIRFGNRI